MHLAELPPGDRLPQVVNMVVEIPRGTSNKVEYDTALGAFRLDRVLYSPVHYPGDYGFIPRTLADDGDPVDIIALVTVPTFPGCVMAVRPLGMLAMQDEKGRDEKIVAVPESDPRFDDLASVDDLSPHRRRELEYFFDIYKELEGKESAVLGWRPRADAHEAIRRAAAAWEPTRP